MDDLALPADLAAFLDAGRQLEYDPAGCEAGAVTLFPRSALRLRMFDAQLPESANGVRPVPGVDLVAGCTGDYAPHGLLVWFPGPRSYGTWDEAHDYVRLFGPAVTWADIAAAPARFLNARWDFPDLDRAPAEFLDPWAPAAPGR